MLISYLKTAYRSILRNTEYTLINILGLSVSIAASIFLFNVLHFERSFDDFHPGRNSIYRVVMDFKYPEGDVHTSGVQAPMPEAFRTDFPQLEKAATIFNAANSQINVLTDDKQGYQKRFKEEKGVIYAEPEFFDIFNFPLLQGNAHQVLSEQNSAMLSRSTAEKYFGSWRNAMGKFIELDHHVIQIAGILDDIPANSDFPLKVVVSFNTRKETNMNWEDVTSSRQFFIRLPQHTDVVELEKLLPAFEKKHYDTEKSAGRYALQPLSEIHFDQRYGNLNRRTIGRPMLLSLAVIGLFVLATAGINFVNLATAQVVKRSKEVGIRKALGSSRSQLIFRFFGETFLILVAASVLALAELQIALPFLVNIFDLPQSFGPLLTPLTFVLLPALVLTLTLVSGLYPALVMSGFRPIQALKNKIDNQSIGGFSLRKGLVVFQFVIAQVLITVTIVMVSQMKFVRNTSLGFDKEGIIDIPVPTDSISRQSYDAFRNSLLQLPGIKNLSFSYAAPSWNTNRTSTFYFDEALKEESFEVNQKYADTSFFSTYNIPLVAGRIFKPTATGDEYVVNETLVKKLGLTDPEQILGRTINISGIPIPVVGVMKDFHVRSLHQPMEPLVISNDKTEFHIVSLKLPMKDLEQTMGKVESIYSSLFPAQIFEYHFLDEQLMRNYQEEQRMTALINLLSGIAIFISCLGLYGLISFITVQKTKEVGIRKVLGASVSDILLILNKQFVLLIVAAFVIAAPVAAYLMGLWLQSFTYHINMNILIFVTAMAATLVIALLTISMQSIKAATANPVKSLRSE